MEKKNITGYNKNIAGTMVGVSGRKGFNTGN